MSIEVKTTVRFRPFDVPDCAYLMVGLEESSDDPAIPITELEIEVVETLAERWLDHLFAVVNQPSPFARATRRG